MKGRMKYQLILNEYIDKHSPLEPITNKEFYAHVALKTDDMPNEVKAAVNMALSRLTESRKDFFRLQSGIYYRAKKTIFGYAKLDNASVIRKKYITEDNDEIIGYESGLSLLNKCGLTTQVPAYSYVATNKHKGRGIIKVCKLNTYLTKPIMEVNKDNYLYLQVLELISLLSKSKEFILAKNPHKIIYNHITMLGLDASMLMYYAGMCNLNLANELINVFYQGRLNETSSR